MVDLSESITHKWALNARTSLLDYHYLHISSQASLYSLNKIKWKLQQNKKYQKNKYIKRISGWYKARLVNVTWLEYAFNFLNVENTMCCTRKRNARGIAPSNICWFVRMGITNYSGMPDIQPSLTICKWDDLTLEQRLFNAKNKMQRTS